MWMLETVKEFTRNPFGQNFDTLFAHLDTDKDGKVKSLDEFRGLLFGDIYANFGLADRPYEELKDKEFFAIVSQLQGAQFAERESK